MSDSLRPAEDGSGIAQEHLEEDGAILHKEGFSAHELAYSESLVEQLRSNNTELTTKLMQRPRLLSGLIQIATRPDYYSKNHGIQLTHKHTHNAVEWLSNLSQEFTNTSQIAVDSQTGPTCHLINLLFSFMEDPKPLLETAAGYAIKIMTPFLYQKPKDVIDPLLSLLCCQAPLRRSDKVLIVEIEDEGEFFSQQKVIITTELIEEILSKICHTNPEDSLETLENLASTVAMLFDKTSDRFEQKKFKAFFLQIFGNGMRLLKLFVSKAHPLADENMKTQLLASISSILSVYLPLEAQKRSENDDNSFQQEPVPASSLEMVVALQRKLTEETFISSNKLLLIEFMRLSTIIVWIHEKGLPEFIDVKFTSCCLGLIVRNPKCDVLITQVKKLISIILIKSPETPARLLKEDSDFFNLTSKAIQGEKSLRDARAHLFTVTEQILKANSQQGNEVVAELQAKIKERRKLYETKICATNRLLSSEGEITVEEETVSLMDDKLEKLFRGNGNYADQEDANSQQMALPMSSDEDGIEDFLQLISSKSQKQIAEADRPKQESPSPQKQNNKSSSKKEGSDNHDPEDPGVGASFQRSFRPYIEFHLEELMKELL